MKILLIFLPILALPLTRLSAIGITLDRIQFSVGLDSIEVYPPFSRFKVSNEAYPFFSPNYTFDWRYGNTEESAFLSGSWYVRGFGLYSGANVSFTLTEPVSFLLTGAIRQGEWAVQSFTSLSASLGG